VKKYNSVLELLNSLIGENNTPLYNSSQTTAQYESEFKIQANTTYILQNFVTLLKIEETKDSKKKISG